MQLQTPQFDQDSFEFGETASNPAANTPVASTLNGTFDFHEFSDLPGSGLAPLR